MSPVAWLCLDQHLRLLFWIQILRGFFGRADFIWLTADLVSPRLCKTGVNFPRPPGEAGRDQLPAPSTECLVQSTLFWSGTIAVPWKSVLSHPQLGAHTGLSPPRQLPGQSWNPTRAARPARLALSHGALSFAQEGELKMPLPEESVA